MGQCIICLKTTKFSYRLREDTPEFFYCKRDEFLVKLYVVETATDDDFNPEKYLKNARRNTGEKVAKRPTKKGK